MFSYGRIIALRSFYSLKLGKKLSWRAHMFGSIHRSKEVTKSKWAVLVNSGRSSSKLSSIPFSSPLESVSARLALRRLFNASRLFILWTYAHTPTPTLSLRLRKSTFNQLNYAPTQISHLIGQSLLFLTTEKKESQPPVRNLSDLYVIPL